MQVLWLLVDWSVAESYRDNGTFNKEFASSSKWNSWVFDPQCLVPSDSANQFQDAMAVYEDALAKLQPANKATIQQSIGNVLGAPMTNDLQIKHDEIYATYSPQRVCEMAEAFGMLDNKVIAKLFENSKSAQLFGDCFADGNDFSQYIRQWHRVAQEAKNTGRGILASVS